MSRNLTENAIKSILASKSDRNKTYISGLRLHVLLGIMIHFFLKKEVPCVMTKLLIWKLLSLITLQTKWRH